MSPALTWGPAPAAVAPSFANIDATPDSVTSVVVSWDVSPAAQGEVRYGTVSGLYGNVTKREVNALTWHSQRIIGLTAGTTYYYVVWGRDPLTGLEAVSSEGTFELDATPSADYPIAIPFVFLAKPTLTIPAVGEVKTDPQYGTEVTRLSGTGARVRYSSKAVLNANGTLGLLDGTAGQRLLFDGQTLVPIVANATTYGAFTWSTVNPTRAYAYSNPNVIRILDVGLSGTSIVRSVTLSAYSQIVLGGNQGSQSNDDRYLALKWVKSNGNAGIAVFDTVSETVTAEVTIAASGTISTVDACGVSQSGQYVVVVNSANGTGASQGVWVYVRSTLSTSTRRFLTTGGDHWDAGLLEDGTTDVWVAGNQSVSGGTEQGGSTGCIGMYRMDTGAYTPLKQNFPNSVMSCRNISRPGYCYPSSYSATGTFAGFSVVFAIRFADPPYAGGDVEVFGNFHGVNDTTYDNQVNACASPSGDRVFVNANWDGAASQAYAFGMDVIQ